MQKLIELLNECTNGRFKTEQDLRLCIEMRGYCRDFVKWLVENDKIDRTFRENVRYPYYLEKEGLLQGYEKSDVIIMLLSISDTPIKDLLLYLK